MQIEFRNSHSILENLDIFFPRVFEDTIMKRVSVSLMSKYKKRKQKKKKEMGQDVDFIFCLIKMAALGLNTEMEIIFCMNGFYHRKLISETKISFC